MAEFEKINDDALEDAAGGRRHSSSNRRYVYNIKSGYLAIRTAPNYDYNNEIRGSELYNDDVVYIEGDYVRGRDGRTYVWVYSPKTRVYGYVNANYLTW